MFQYLENTTKTSKHYWQIDLIGQKIAIKYGLVNEATVETIERVCEDDIQAFHQYKNEIVEKIRAGYYDPEEKVTEANFLDSVYETYLKQNQLEEAVAWLEGFSNLTDPSYEDQLINTCLSNKNYIIAEKYVLEKIKVIKDADVIIRQVCYLSQINPMLCRFMIGNLPPNPDLKDALGYYQNLASAQAKIGMFSMVSKTLKVIRSDYVKIVVH